MMGKARGKEEEFDNLTDKSYLNVDDRNNVDMVRISTRETN